MWIRWCITICLLEAGRSDPDIIQPRSQILQEGQAAHMNCVQTKGHNAMYWYRQAVGQPLEHLFTFQGNIQMHKGNNLERFEGRQFQTKNCELNISRLKRDDSSLYFCASSWDITDRLYFGPGTRLTVLENGQEPTPPQVTIFAPSQKETEEKQAVTLVCLAKDFIPDHVSITWHLHDTEITEGVKTEEFSKYHNKTKSYSLTSRLRVSKLVWENSQNQFQCKVKFYVNDTTEIYESTISREGCDTAKVSYQSNGYIGSFVYVLLILKSIVYGAFVMGLFLRKKRVQ